MFLLHTKKNKKEKHREKARFYALQCLYTWYICGKRINSITVDFLKNKNKNKFDINYFYKIVLGVILHTTLLNKFFLLYKKVPIYYFSVTDILVFKITLFEFLLVTMENKKKKFTTNDLELLRIYGNISNIKFINSILKNIQQKHLLRFL